MKIYFYFIIAIIAISQIKCRSKKDVQTTIPKDTIFFADTPLEKIIIDSVESKDSSIKDEIRLPFDTISKVHKDTFIESVQLHDKITDKTTSKLQRNLIYRVQLASSKKPLPAVYFKKIDNVSIETYGGYFKYVTQEYDNLDDAFEGRQSIIEKGIRDAWIVVYEKGKRIKAEEAKEIIDSYLSKVEKTLKKPLMSKPESQGIDLHKPENIYFRIQLAASKQPVDKKFYQNIENVEIEHHAGLMKYVTPIEKDFTKVKDLQKNIKMKGHKNAWIVSYYSGKRIAMEEVQHLVQAETQAEVADYLKEKSLINNRVDLAAAKKEEGIYFRVQLAASKKKLPEVFFKNINENRELENHEGYLKYVTGYQNDFKKAEILKKNMINQGIKDAWIVCYLDGVRINMQDVQNHAILPETKSLITNYLNNITQEKPVSFSEKKIDKKTESTIIKAKPESSEKIEESIELSQPNVSKETLTKELPKEPASTQIIQDEQKSQPTTKTEKPTVTENEATSIIETDEKKAEPTIIKANPESSEKIEESNLPTISVAEDYIKTEPENVSDDEEKTNTTFKNNPESAITVSKETPKKPASSVKRMETETVYFALEKALEKPEKAQNLDLSNQNITEVPMDVMKLPQLRVLNLFDNDIKILPAEIENMNNLKVLSLGKNSNLDFKDTFKKLSKIPQLEELYLSFNNMSELPTEIGNLVNLEKLILFHNQIDSIPHEIGNLTKLKQLGFSYCLFTKLPDEIVNLQTLEEVFLITNNELNIEDAIKKLGKLKNLKKLHFYDNRLIYIPSAIGKLTSLEELDLGSNQLTFLPKDVEKLINLKKVDLSGNQFVELPTGIEMIPNLEELKLNFNLLTDFPGKLGPFSKLKKLDLGINKFTICPPSISKLQSLVWLNLRGNKISPEEINKFKKSLPKARIIY